MKKKTSQVHTLILLGIALGFYLFFIDPRELPMTPCLCYSWN